MDYTLSPEEIHIMAQEALARDLETIDFKVYGWKDTQINTGNQVRNDRPPRALKDHSSIGKVFDSCSSMEGPFFGRSRNFEELDNVA